jgi:hypothetical protein
MSLGFGHGCQQFFLGVYTMTDFFSILLLAFLGGLMVLCGWLLANFMRLLDFPSNPTERFFTGLIWLAVGFIVFFVFTADKDLTNMVTACAMVGFVLRSGMEWMLRLREQMVAEETAQAVEALSTPAERKLPSVQIIMVPHRLGGTGIDRLV